MHSLSGIGVPRAELQQGASFFMHTLFNKHEGSSMQKSKYHGIEKTAEVCVIWLTSAEAQMGKMIEQYDRSNYDMRTL